MATARHAVRAKPQRLWEVMQTPVEVVAPNASASEAWHRMCELGMRHLVVVDGREVVGVLSQRDLGGPRGLAVRSGQAVGELMSPEPQLAEADMSVQEAARLLARRSLGCLPVLDCGRLVGIVTSTDLLEVLGSQRPASAGRG